MNPENTVGQLNSITIQNGKSQKRVQGIQSQKSDFPKNIYVINDVNLHNPLYIRK